MNNINTKSTLIKSLAIVLLVGLLSKEVRAQNEPMYSQYMFNMMAANPAYAGSRGAIGLNYFGRAQWSGIGGAPTTNSISIDGSTLDGRFGLGMQMYHDHIGVYNNNVINFMFSSRVKVSDEGVLSGGIQIGMKNSQINLTNVKNVYDLNDYKFQQNVNEWNPTLGGGVFYNTDKFYLGVSVPNILSSANIYSGVGKTNDYHMFIATGYVFDIDEDIKLKPSTLLKLASGAPAEFDLNANVWYKNMFGIGASLRTGDAYDYTISDLRTIAGSTNEVMIRYEFGKESKNVKSTRYF